MGTEEEIEEEIKKYLDFKSKIMFLPILPYMRKPGYLITGAEYHVTAKINRGEFALEPKEIFLKTGKTNSGVLPEKSSK